MAMKKRPPIKNHMIESKKALKEIMQDQLAGIAGAVIKQVMGKAKRSTPSKMLNSIKNIDHYGVNEYKNQMRTALAIIATDALDQARKEVPKAKHVKLASGDGRFHLAEFDDLPKEVQERIKAEIELLIGTQLSDVDKAVFYAFTSNYNSTDSMDLLQSDLESAAEDFVGGSAIDAGAQVLASTLINEARNAFFFDDEVKDQIDAAQFVNPSPVTEICDTLNGVIFSLDDPLADRFVAPFHWNCKTFIVPILKGKVDPDDIEDLVKYSYLEAEMQFSESESRTVFLLSQMCGHRH